MIFQKISICDKLSKFLHVPKSLYLTLLADGLCSRLWLPKNDHSNISCPTCSFGTFLLLLRGRVCLPSSDQDLELFWQIECGRSSDTLWVSLFLNLILRTQPPCCGEVQISPRGETIWRGSWRGTEAPSLQLASISSHASEQAFRRF